MTESKEQRAKGKGQSGLPTAHRPPRTDYIELHARSAFSFLEGASTPEELIGAGAKMEMPAMALLDRDGVYGAPRFHMAAKKNGIKAHIGAEIAVPSSKFQVPSSKLKVLRPKSKDQRPAFSFSQIPNSLIKRCR